MLGRLQLRADPTGSRQPGNLITDQRCSLLTSNGGAGRLWVCVTTWEKMEAMDVLKDS